MKPALRYITIVFLLTLARCSKKDGDDSKTPPANVYCHAQLADAENISIFPSDNEWHKDITGMQVDASSTQILSSYSGTGLHADFGSGLYQGKTIGIPYTVVCDSQPKVAIVYRKNSYDGNYGNESDPGPYPIPANAPVEQDGDAHVIVVDKDNHKLYELYNAGKNGDHWEASSGALFDLNSNTFRKDGWTSADAAGLPIFAGLVRYEEVLKGTINHPIRFTLAKGNTTSTWISPARHAGNGSGAAGAALPFGTRLRLKPGFDISTYPARVKVILQAMKKYGLILADIGSNMYITGAPDDRWDNDELQQLSKVKAGDFEVMKLTP